MPWPTPCSPIVPVTLFIASRKSLTPCSSSCLRVITLMDCGMSLSDWSPLLRLTAEAASEPVPSLVALRSPCAVTVTVGKVLVSDAPGVALMTMASPWRTAIRPLPASRRSAACCGVSVPETAGAVLPSTKAGAKPMDSPVAADSACSAEPSGWAAIDRLLAWLAGLDGVADWACAASGIASTSAAASASGAGWKRAMVDTEELREGAREAREKRVEDMVRQCSK